MAGGVACPARGALAWLRTVRLFVRWPAPCRRQVAPDTGHPGCRVGARIGATHSSAPGNDQDPALVRGWPTAHRRNDGEPDPDLGTRLFDKGTRVPWLELG